VAGNAAHDRALDAVLGGRRSALRQQRDSAGRDETNECSHGEVPYDWLPDGLRLADTTGRRGTRFRSLARISSATLSEASSPRLPTSTPGQVTPRAARCHAR